MAKKPDSQELIDNGVIWNGNNIDQVRSYVSKFHDIARANNGKDIILVSTKGNRPVKLGQTIKKKYGSDNNIEVY